MRILYEDNHIIIVNKRVGDIVQGDKTGDVPLSDKVKAYLKERYAKPGDVFLGVVHRLDRPASGALLFARTSKALSRLNQLFASHGEVRKTYWAIVCNEPPEEQATLTHWLTRTERNNTAHAYDREVTGSRKAVLDYRVIGRTDRYWLLEVLLHTGRHHQIRCQLSRIGCPIRGDLKYGAPRSNADGGISLHARRLEFRHPVTQELVDVTAPLPDEPLWQAVGRMMTTEEEAR
ncbi:MAG: RNA pseudouridine synthase [Prevotellaceae bacterium]|nr:RNA pseudouridine synthase [Prevotellaceae bacterium]